VASVGDPLRHVFFELLGLGLAPNPQTHGCTSWTAAIPGQGSLTDEGGRGGRRVIRCCRTGPTRANGGLTVVSPAGEVLQFLEMAVGSPVPLPSNLCFGGEDRRTAWVTCGGSGLLVKVRVSVPGLAPHFGGGPA
jgi:gluconolactonase